MVWVRVREWCEMKLFWRGVGSVRGSGFGASGVRLLYGLGFRVRVYELGSGLDSCGLYLPALNFKRLSLESQT